MINVEALSLKLGNFKLENINLHIDSGDFFALLGPSGSGKTMLLECIAGLKFIQKGKILLNGHDITHKKPEERNISICYQAFALFPHMKVKDNIKYGLRFKKDGNHPKYAENYNMLVSFLKIEHILDRYPAFLSGGEKQRVALARALIINPDILLLDEPLSALDANIKENIEAELKSLHKKLKTTTIMVTHNFSEAYALADKIAIIKDGSIVQTGKIEEVFQKPKTAFVAQFVGMKNLFDIPDNFKNDFPKAVRIGIRPEHVMISNQELGTPYEFIGAIQKIKNSGIYLQLDIATDNGWYQSYVTPNIYHQLDLYEGKKVYVGFNPEDVTIFS